MRLPLLLFSLILLYSSTGKGQDSTWMQIDLADNTAALLQENPLDKARFLAKRVSTRRTEGPMRVTLLANYGNTSRYFFEAEHFDKALNYIDSTLVIADTLANVPALELAKFQFFKSQVIFRLNNSHHSRLWLNKCFTTLQNAIDNKEAPVLNAMILSLFLTNGAYLHATRGNATEAQLLLKQSSALVKEFIDAGIPSAVFRQSQQMSHLVQGIIYFESGKHALAEKEYLIMNASEPKVPGNRTDNQIRAADALTVNYLASKQYDKALVILEDGIDYINAKAQKTREEKVRLATYYAYVASTQKEYGKYSDAFTTLAKAKKATKDISFIGKRSDIRGLIARVTAETYAAQGKFDQANVFFEEAHLTLFKNVPISTENGLPVIAAGKYSGPRRNMVKYLNVRQEAFLLEADAGNADALPLALTVSFKLDSFLNRNRNQLTLTASHNRVIEQERRHYAAAIDVALRLYRETGTSQYLEDAYYFASSQKSNLLNRYLNSPNLAKTLGVPQEIVERQQKLELEVLILEQQLNTANEADRASVRNKLLQVNRELDFQRENITSDYPDFSKALRGYDRLDLTTTRQLLPSGQLIVEYFLSDSTIYVFTIDKKGLDHLVLPRPDSLEQLIIAANTDAVAAAKLYQTIVAPVLRLHSATSSAQKSDITRLQFIPDGDLWQTSFAALRKDNRYLIEDYAISYAYGSSMLFSDRSGQAIGKGYLGYGISYDDIIRRINASTERSVVGNQLRNLGPLPFARQEVNEAAAIMSGTERINADATKTLFLQEAPEAGILHLAMHGIIKDNPMGNALVFRGAQDTFDLLTMEEVLARKFPAALTILSACHSGNGPLQQNEGVQSIGRAFTAAGSRSTITSAWEAQDEGTYKILTAFYAELDTGMPLDVALQTATKAFLKSETDANRQPVNWANLKLHGAVAPIKETNWWLWGLLLVLVGSSVGFAWTQSRN